MNRGVRSKGVDLEGRLPLKQGKRFGLYNEVEKPLLGTDTAVTLQRDGPIQPYTKTDSAAVAAAGVTPLFVTAHHAKTSNQAILLRQHRATNRKDDEFAPG